MIALLEQQQQSRRVIAVYRYPADNFRVIYSSEIADSSYNFFFVHATRLWTINIP